MSTLAHSGPVVAPLANISLVFAALLWAVGTARLARRSAVRRVVRRGNLAAGWGGLAVLWVALCSPLDADADVAVSLHMVQHLLIGLVAPLLWSLARPTLVFSSILEPAGRRRVNRWIATGRRRWDLRRNVPRVGLAAMCLHVAVWWGWHLPPLFDAALRNDVLHALEHLCLFVAGLLLWWVCLGARWHDRGALAILYLFGAAVGTGIIGALLTIVPTPVYATSAAALRPWGLTRLSDQQLGGVIMWVAGGAIYLTIASVLAVRWLGSGPSRLRAPDERHEAQGPLVA